MWSYSIFRSSCYGWVDSVLMLFWQAPIVLRFFCQGRQLFWCFFDGRQLFWGIFGGPPIVLMLYCWGGQLLWEFFLDKAATNPCDFHPSSHLNISHACQGEERSNHDVKVHTHTERARTLQNWTLFLVYCQDRDGQKYIWRIKNTSNLNSPVSIIV